MCGIVGIIAKQAVAAEIFESLIHLQHRGQDAVGILTYDTKMHLKVGKGLVNEFLKTDHLDSLTGNIGIGHLRYPTSGSTENIAEAQPLTLVHPYGIALAHNGNLVNYHSLAQKLLAQHRRHLNTHSDSEVLIHILANNLAEQPHAENEVEFFQHLCAAVNKLQQEVQGSYSVISAIVGKGLFAFRDPHGNRPLVMGERLKDNQIEYCFASENTPFHSLGFTLAGDIAPGEIIYISESGNLYRQVLLQKKFHPCIFEYVYFARPDATINDINVYRARLRMGENLAKAWQKEFPTLRPDVVVPVPFTSNTAALAFARELNLNYSEGLYKNPFIGRTFIMPSQVLRKRSVKHKLIPQPFEIKGKNVLLIDDSIVRGTTSREIVKMVREAGARKIYFASACPPIKFPCYYGINIPTKEELIAHQKSIAEIKAYLEVDELLYQSIDDLVEAVTRKGEHHITEPCLACLNGKYVCGKIEKT
ncbi:MAG: amidophosphoribosyltransferase [Gammaproteobacteria bacterium RIFCSPHIGHO2_12_FULL_35_23]|nr:MAG: amidophosphoribosyltransferase [Gammaproteobacteria bacterium RIFCSPHIGHO2_12_FULL_35_23]